MQSHDQRFKILLREFFPEFFQLFFPQWAERFDFTTLAWLDKEVFADPPQGERRIVDIVARLQTALNPADDSPGTQSEWIALVHVEVEWDDKVAPLRPRMFDYYRHLRMRYERPVLPIGLYLRVGLDGLGWDSYEERFWEHVIARFQYPYIGLPALDGESYVQGNNWLGVALAALMRIPEERKAQIKAEALRRLSTSQENNWRRYLLCECVETYLPMEGHQLAEYEHLLRTEPYMSVMKIGQTSFEKGHEKGQRVLVERWLIKRFGPLSSQAREKLAAWPADQLEDLGDAIVTAQSLKELGLED